MADDDWPEVVRNLSQARAVWKRMTRILSREGTELQVSVFFFKAVVQVVLLFGSETWVVTPPYGQSTGGFQDQVAQQLTGRLTQQKTERKWEYTLAATAREEAGFQMMEQYIRRLQSTVAQYIATRSLLDLC